MTSNVRVRFAPSPTGYLHVGGARTALYNWLFAKKHNGKFILRIEDTDQVRSTDEATQAILDGMSWIGLSWDEGPFYQTKRMDLYKNFAQQLLDEGKAFHCYCSSEELSAMRKEQEANKQAPKYNGKCRHLTNEQKQALEAEGRKPVVRFKLPDSGIITVKDIIHGDVKFDAALLDDFVIFKSDGFPTYNFAVTIDDNDMKITHVIRGDDHLSNTPRQILIYNALGFELPIFAHIPMILGQDKARLSKRHGATSVIAYKDMGYLPEAMINYLSRLGWGYGDQEIFTINELINCFDIPDVNKTPAVFDMVKLEWLNAHYIRGKSIDELIELTGPYLEKAYPKYVELQKTPQGQEKIKKLLKDLQERIKTVNEIVDHAGFFLLDEITYDQEAFDKHVKEAGAKEILEKLKDALELIDPFTKENIEPVFRNLAKDLGIKAGKVIHPARVALTGRSDSPPMFDTVELIGKEESIKRLKTVLTKLLS